LRINNRAVEHLAYCADDDSERKDGHNRRDNDKNRPLHTPTPGIMLS
jgi:hypothetical protein